MKGKVGIVSMKEEIHSGWVDARSGSLLMAAFGDLICEASSATRIVPDVVTGLMMPPLSLLIRVITSPDDTLSESPKTAFNAGENLPFK